MLKIYNTLTQQKEDFKPINPGQVGLYVCGITVYDYCHLGHARTQVAFDVITRYLRAHGFNVKYVRNITDIDDKIINRARENNEDYHVLTDRFINAMHEDFAALQLLPPTEEPRATNFMPQMLAMIEKLIEKKFAYVAENGDVYYSVSAYKDYGQLSHKDLDGLRAGARVEIGEVKRDPLDFVLWKAAKPNEPSWDSPWGKGRPGWHIECSAMSTFCLGEHFDLHGGGADLQFPHHENEIAQAEAATGKKFVNCWMHGGFLQINQEKMSKSLNNFFTIRDALTEYSAEVLRYFLVSSHYRSPLNYSIESLDNAKHSLERFYLTLRGLPTVACVNPTGEYRTQFFAAMDDDFNTPEALAILFEIAREINKIRVQNPTHACELGQELRELASILGLLQTDPEVYLQASADDNEEIEQLIAARNQARHNKNWAESDRIRDELLAKGIVLEDSAKGTIWRRK